MNNINMLMHDMWYVIDYFIRIYVHTCKYNKYGYNIIIFNNDW